MTVPPHAAVSTRSRRQPRVVAFASDLPAATAVAQCTRLARGDFEELATSAHDGALVVVLSDPKIFEEHVRALRSPRVRVIALRNERFRDPRLDGSVYAYLSPGSPVELLERLCDNAIDHLHLVETRREVSDKLAQANSEISTLNRIGAALSAQHDSRSLLELILTRCREITQADAGSIYLLEEVGAERRRQLRFSLAQNDSRDLPFREAVLPLGDGSVAGWVAERGTVVMIEDAYELESWAPYAVNKQFDHDSGYRTRSILAVPMANPKHEVIGVVQLINAKRDPRARLDGAEAVAREVIPFTTRQMEIVSSLASQAAVAFENSKLYEDIHRLFEGFVNASVKAIEQRDPATFGHSFRVAHLTMKLAEAVHRDEQYFAGVGFTNSEMKELRYAALLHDVGKVGVREAVLTKARKLYPEQLELIRSRFDAARRALQAEHSERKLRCLLERGREAYESELEAMDAGQTARLCELDAAFELVRAANEPSLLPEEVVGTLHELARRQVVGPDGHPHPLLTAEELRLLSIRRGTLDERERLEAESHVAHTYNLLRQIPWTDETRNVPELALGHHEKVNGQGYPNGLKAEAIPLQTRLMTIADIFDALASHDRPYKDEVSVAGVLEILAQMARDGEIDARAFAVFVEERVYEHWRREEMA